MRFVSILCLIFSLLLAMVMGRNLNLNLSRYSGKKYSFTVRVDAGSNFTVSLKSNPTTGYSWATYDQDLEKAGLLKVIKYLDQDYTENPNPGGLLGVGGVSKLKFAIIGEGKGILNLFYAQQWDLKPKIENGENVDEYIGMSIPINAVKPRQ